jgi:hypothetical protein
VLGVGALSESVKARTQIGAVQNGKVAICGLRVF